MAGVWAGRTERLPPSAAEEIHSIILSLISFGTFGATATFCRANRFRRRELHDLWCANLPKRTESVPTRIFRQLRFGGATSPALGSFSRSPADSNGLAFRYGLALSSGFGRLCGAHRVRSEPAGKERGYAGNFLCGESKGNGSPRTSINIRSFLLHFQVSCHPTSVNTVVVSW